MENYLSEVRMTEQINDECRISERLIDLMNRTHYELVQENGQRRLTAPELTKEYRDRIKGAEVFLGRLPRNCYEDELMPVLEKAGRLLELRLMLDFSGTTRGYAFALYEDAKTARRARSMLDGYSIRPGHKIGVVKSIDNCRLFFGGVPKDKTKAEFAEELGKILDGISDIYLYPNAQDRTQNRGFIFVEFKDHRSAAMARRKLIPGRVILWDHEVAVDWADPEPGESLDEEVMENVTALFVRNLPLELPHQKVREIFHKVTGIPILKLKKINHFAFVHYESREMAKKVLEIANVPGGIAEQHNWEVCWAKPIGSSKILERQRAIREAVAGANSGDSQQFQNSKQPTGTYNKRHTAKKNKHGEPLSPSVNSISPSTLNRSPEITRATIAPISPPRPIPTNDKKILEDFITQKLGAQCHFICVPVVMPPGFICKILIIRNQQIMYEFQGGLYSTQDQAINVTSRVVYHQLVNNITKPIMVQPVAYAHTNIMPSRMEACH
ncbi:probable RNA-binding protein 46 isoform X1 [Microplitis demolitor]|uniref:probable RNA-binding protein 46 isoform X1 n=2 Tax=Microplitis demolitor TaxID=69319 RepID=UPI0004CD43D1|nr:probable RNA-binding protein 46 isoform X1 [Microplitis demolitor]